MRYTYDLLGAYLDAIAGINSIRQQLVDFQQGQIAKLRDSVPERATESFMDEQPMSHEFEGGSSGPQKLLHRTSQGEFKGRTASGGSDARVLGWMAITLLYGQWEDKYRNEIAMAAGLPNKNELKSDLFGDLGKLRHAIVHNQGIATQKVADARVLRWFAHGDRIVFTPEHLDRLVDLIDTYISQLCGVEEPLRLTEPK